MIKQLVEARQNAGLTQEEAAKRWGRGQTIVAKIESCERRIDAAEFISLCIAIGVEPAPLIQGIRESFF